MNPSPEAVAAIRSKVSDWGPDDPTVAANLNAPGVPNPVAQGMVPKPYDAVDLVTACSAGSRPNLVPMLAGAAAGLILANASGPLAAGLDALAVAGAISTADASTMRAVLFATAPDPAWQPQISWAQSTLGRPVDSLDIAASRPGA